MKNTYRKFPRMVVRIMADTGMPLKLSAAVTLAALIVGSAFQGAHAPAPNANPTTYARNAAGDSSTSTVWLTH